MGWLNRKVNLKEICVCTWFGAIFPIGGPWEYSKASVWSLILGHLISEGVNPIQKSWHIQHKFNPLFSLILLKTL